MMSTPEPSPPTVYTEPVPLVYANWFRTVPTPSELSLDLGYRGVGDPQPALRLVMAWPYVAEIRELLTEMIRQYEEATGETVPEPDLKLGPARFVPRS
jgi:hypothetical protein